MLQSRTTTSARGQRSLTDLYLQPQKLHARDQSPRYNRRSLESNFGKNPAKPCRTFFLCQEIWNRWTKMALQKGDRTQASQYPPGTLVKNCLLLHTGIMSGIQEKGCGSTVQDVFPNSHENFMKREFASIEDIPSGSPHLRHATLGTHIYFKNVQIGC